MKRGNKLYVIGIGYKPLDKRAREVILGSEFILANNRLLEVFKGYEEYERVKEKVKVINNVDETIDYIRRQITEPRGGSPQKSPDFWKDSIENEERLSSVPSTLSSSIVLLASGDPMFFGIGRRVIREFGKENVEIIPDLSSIQLAFSRIKEPWDDAFLMSLHGGPHPEKRRKLLYEIEDLPWLIEKFHKIAILTDKENNPTKIASTLLPCVSAQLKIYVCERLGYPDERIIEGTPEEIANKSFEEPNVVIIVRPVQEPNNSGIASQEIKFGLTEDEILHSRGFITKDEIRAITIHKLRIPQKGVLWDIGAGSGSVSIEAARLSPFLKVFAIERDEEQLGHIINNVRRFNLQNIEIIKGEAPQVLQGLPLPDRIFIGGSGGRLEEILGFINQINWSGILVINATTLETLHTAFKLLETNYLVDVVQVQLSRLKPLGDKHHLSAQNPVFIISAQRPIGER